jgi:hypothetical protein
MPSPLGSLEPVDLRTIWPDEARDFTPWLAQEENLRRLSDALNLELELDRVEVAVGPYSADIVATDASSNSKVVIENQLEKTNHDHLGKVLTYASGLEARILIWIAKKFTEEHRQTFDYLNECTSGRLRLYGVEVEVLRIGNSLPAPHFRLVSTPNDYVAAAHNATAELSDAKSLYMEFWTGFRDYCRAQGEMFSLQSPRPQHWYTVSIGRSGFSISLTASTMHSRLGCELYLRGPNAKQSFRVLKKSQQDIEAVLGTLAWQELPEKQDCRIVDYLKDFDPRQRSDWDRGFGWMKKRAEEYRSVFAPRVRAIPGADEPESQP